MYIYHQLLPKTITKFAKRDFLKTSNEARRKSNKQRSGGKQTTVSFFSFRFLLFPLRKNHSILRAKGWHPADVKIPIKNSDTPARGGDNMF